MDNYFAEDNAVKFDHQNGNIETICFCVSKQSAKRIAAALNLLDNQEGQYEKRINKVCNKSFKNF